MHPSRNSYQFVLRKRNVNVEVFVHMVVCLIQRDCELV